jgi:tetratricopeptide (TPR) repeat protein
LAINNNWGKVPPSFAGNYRGVILEHLGRFNEALQSYQQAVANNPGDEVPKNNRSILEARLSNNPSLRNQSQQAPEPQQGNNFLETLLGALPGAFNENQTGEEAVLDFLISLIPIIGQVADARDFAAYLYRIVFKKQFKEPGNWIGLALTLVGLVPVVGDIAKYLGKSASKGNLPDLVKNAERVWEPIRSLNPELADNIPQLKAALAQNWGNGVEAAKEQWNTALSQLLNWANGIPDLFLSQQKQQLIKAIEEVSRESNTMLSKAFEEIWKNINEALDEIGRRINPNGELVTPEGVRLPSDGVDEGINRPMLSQGSGSQRQPNRSLEGIRNVANPKDESLLNSIRERLSRGNMKLQELDKGGFGTIYQIPDHPALVIKLATDSQGGINEQLLKEATNLFNLTQKGYPTVYKGVIEWVGSDGMIRQGIVMEKVEGTLSKRILRTGKFSNEPIDPSIEALVRPKTLEDLRRFRQKADNDDIIIEDLQFMISERDGSIYLIDPARVEQLPSRGQKRKEMKTQYLKRIDGIIEQFRLILTKNQR